MTLEDITRLASGHESETLEFKQSTGRHRAGTATLCAMLNHRGGVVLFCVTLEGKVAGQQVSDQTLQDVSAEIQMISPPAYPAINRIRASSGLDVIAISVSPGTAQPYQYKGKAYRRVGNTTVTMSAEEYNKMLIERVHQQQRWENQPATGWTIEDLDLHEIRRTVTLAVQIGRLNDSLGQNPEDMLRGLGLMREGVLVRAAAVLFGKPHRLEYELPQCRLRVARFTGLDRSEFSDNRQFIGNAFFILSQAEAFLRETLPIASRFDRNSMKRIDEPLYPPLATREAIANGLCHRDYALGWGSMGLAIYDDRLEVSSAGPLRFGLTPSELFEPHESRPWNPLIARTFYRRGIVEEWGRGTLKMAELSLAAGIPHPEIEERSGSLIVCFRHGRSVPPRRRGPAHITRQKVILTLLHESENGLPLREICAEMALHDSERQVKRALTELKNRGLVTVTGRGRAARWMHSSGTLGDQ
ncbi:MAG: putative DNA binding domain-containing protein [Bacteroidota bacterium]|nr:putative DNA binding domain-containing protein [Bacteroidota bacterium]